MKKKIRSILSFVLIAAMIMAAACTTAVQAAAATIHTISYYVDGGLYKQQQYETGAKITPLAQPTKDGYVFSGWSTIPDTMPDNDVIVNGEFEISSDSVKLPALYQVTASSLTMRSGPSTSYESLGTMSKGTIVTVEKITDDWGYYTHNGISAYSSMKYLQYIGQAEQKADEITVGSTVTINSGATWYDGKAVASWVYNIELVVKSISGDRVVLTNNGTVIGAVNIKDITLVNKDTSGETSDGNYQSNSYGTGSVVARGIDVSYWQGTINWTKVAAAGINFAIIRIGYTGTKDKCFEANLKGAHEAGVDVGVYIYSHATSTQEALADAQSVLTWLDNRALEYPVYFDIEDSRQKSLSKATNTSMVKTFCDEISKNGYVAGLYSGASFMNTYLNMSQLKPYYETWIAHYYDYTDNDRWGYSSSYGMWQYSSKGSVNGISGDVDMNVCFKDYPTIFKAYSLNGQKKNNTSSTVVTSTDFRIHKTDEQFKNSSAYRDYPEFANMYIENSSKPKLCVPVAGLECTNVSGKACTTMVPQGICFAGDYMLVSAYDSEDTANSVIYVYSDSTRKYLTTVVLPLKAHVGGIAYDYDKSGNVWVCNGKSGMISLKYSVIDGAAQSGKAYVALSDSDIIKHTLSGVKTGSKADLSETTAFSASYCTYDSEDSKLWIGEFVSLSKKQVTSGVTSDTGNMYGFTISGKTTASPSLENTNRIQVPDRTQGAAIRTYSGTKYLILSRSYCRKTTAVNYISQIRVYVPSWSTPTDKGFIYKNNAVKSLSLPPMVEGIYMSGSYLYTLFESAATCYYTGSDGSGVCPAPVDRITAFKLTKLLNYDVHSISYVADGVTASTVSGKYGTAVTVPQVPDKTGYIGEWSNVYKTIQDTDCTVNAVYNPISYRVDFYNSTGTALLDSQIVYYDQSVQLKSAQSIGAFSEGQKFNGWRLSNSSTVNYADGQTVSNLSYTNGDIISLYASVEDLNFNLKYLVDGKEYKTETYKFGDKITPLAAPEKEGYTFSGWSEIPSTMPANDVTVNGTFGVNSYKVIYKVDGKDYKTETYKFGDKVTALAAPEKEGYTFSGWSEIPSTMPANDVTVNGTFGVNSYKLIYKVDGKDYKTETYKFGDKVTPLAAPEKEGYTFSGWSEIPSTMPANDVTVNGTFGVNSYKLIYKVDGKEYKTETYKFGDKVTALAAPEKEGYTFSGWSEIPSTMPANDVTVNGTFGVNSYKLIYKVDGKEYKTETYKFGDKVTALAAPEKEGYTFSGWSEIPSTMPSKDVTVNGTFGVNSYKVIYKVDGKDYKTETYKFGDKVTALAAPEKEGYTFSGWSEIPSTMPSKDVTVNGTFTKNEDPTPTTNYATLKVTASQGTGLKVKIGDNKERNQSPFYKNTKVEVGQEIILTPSSTIGTFLYWVDENDSIVSYNEQFKFVMTGNRTLMAVYSCTIEDLSTVTFIGAYDQILAQAMYGTDSEIDVPAYTSKTGCDFVGWSIDGANVIAEDKLQQEILAQIALGNDVTVKAIYKVKDATYKITVENGTGSGTYTTSTLLTITADKAPNGKKFAYWTRNDRIVSYSEAYSFIVNQDAKYVAVYVDENEEVKASALTSIEQVTYDSSTNKMTFVSVSNVPENSNIIYNGVILTSNAGIGENSDAFIKDVSGVVGSGKQLEGDLTASRFSLTKKNVFEGNVWYARSYIIYYDESGKLCTTYGDIVRATVTDSKPVYEYI